VTNPDSVHEQMLKAFRIFCPVWPQTEWHIEVRYNTDLDAVQYTAHAHGPWDRKAKVYGKEAKFGTLGEAVEWLGKELKVHHRFVPRSLPGSDSTCHECGLPAGNPIHVNRSALTHRNEEPPAQHDEKQTRA